MKIRKHFYMYHDYWTMFRLLTDDELGKLMRAIFLYETEAALPVGLDEKLNLIFYTVKDALDREKDRYTAVCNKNKENAKLRWQKKQAVDS